MRNIRIVRPTFIVALALLACVTPSHAQITTNAPSTGSTNQAVRPRRANAVQLRLDRMDQRLSFTPEQKTKIKAIMEETAEKQAAIRKENSGNLQAAAPKIATLRTNETAEIRALLNDEQKAKYDQMFRPRRRQVLN